MIVEPLWVLERQLYQSRYSKRAQRHTKCFLVNGDIFCGLEGQKTIIQKSREFPISRETPGSRREIQWSFLDCQFSVYGRVSLHESIERRGRCG